jgi:predicted dehydrogenase
MAKTVKVGLIGSGFVADIHAHGFRHFVPNAEIVAVASPTPGKAAQFARERQIPNAFEDYRALLAMPEIDMVTLSSGCGQCGQTYRLRKTALSDLGRSGHNDRHL